MRKDKFFRFHYLSKEW